MRPLSILVLLLCLASPAPAQDSARLRAQLTPGDVSRYTVKARMELESPDRAELLDQTLRFRFTVAGVGPGGARIRAALEAIDVTYKPAGEPAAEVHWNEDGPPIAGDAPLERLYRALASTVLEFALAPDGTVTDVAGLDKVAPAGRGLTNPGRAMGVLSTEGAPRIFCNMWTMDPADKPRRAGDRWSTSQVIPSGDWQAEAKTDYTLDSINGASVSISGKTTLTPVRAPANPDDLGPKAVIAAQSILIDARWDSAKSRLISRITTGTVTWKATLLLKEPIEVTSTSKSRIEILLADQPKAEPKPDPKVEAKP